MIEVLIVSSTTAFRLVEEIHSVAIELTKDIGGMGSQKFADAIMTFSDNVVSENSETRNTVGLLRETVESQQQQIDQMQIQINKSAQEIQVLVRWCKSLVGDVTLLKDIALGVSVCAHIMLRDSRFLSVSPSANGVGNQA